MVTRDTIEGFSRGMKLATIEQSGVDVCIQIITELHYIVHIYVTNQIQTTSSSFEVNENFRNDKLESVTL